MTVQSKHADAEKGDEAQHKCTPVEKLKNCILGLLQTTMDEYGRGMYSPAVTDKSDA